MRPLKQQPAPDDRKSGGNSNGRRARRKQDKPSYVERGGCKVGEEDVTFVD